MSDKQNTRPCWVGFDTSNYTTSAAACTLNEEGQITVIANCKAPLPVSEGARGLRQSDAVFAHARNLPAVIRELRGILEAGNYRAVAVGCSATPRDAADSYMPCFLPGVAAAEAFAAGCDVGVSQFSHQNGHIMAALYSSGALAEGTLLKQDFLAFHVSGGTTEAVVAHPRTGGFDVELVGYGADLHAGQVIDRVGVMMGREFPCGRALEQLAVQNIDPLPQIKTSVRDGVCHLSGLENQAADLWKKTNNPMLVSAYVLTTIGKTLRKMTDQIQNQRAERGEPLLPVIYAGGVMSNKFIRPLLTKGAKWKVYFSEPAFSADNAAGTSILCALTNPIRASLPLPTVEELGQAFKKCSDCSLHVDYPPLLERLTEGELTEAHVDYLREACLSKKHVWEIRFAHLRVLLLNPSVRKYDLKAFFAERLKLSRRLSMKLFYIRGYAMYATEDELAPVMERFCASLEKNHDYMDYNEILSIAGLPYLVATYGYECFRKAYQKALEEAAQVPCLLGSYTLNERIEMVQHLSAEECRRQIESVLAGH